jgi:hypothetical protein
VDYTPDALEINEDDPYRDADYVYKSEDEETLEADDDIDEHEVEELDENNQEPSDDDSEPRAVVPTQDPIAEETNVNVSRTGRQRKMTAKMQEYKEAIQHTQLSHKRADRVEYTTE